jgi:beta-glucosidase
MKNRETHNLIAALFVVFIILSSCTRIDKNDNEPGLFRNETILSRVDSLMALMTIEEKIGQLTLFTSDIDVTGPVMRSNYLEDIRSGRAGAIFNAYGAEYTRKLQEVAINETRLGIPLLFGYDVIHGFKTIFPIPLGEASSWDLEYIEKASRIAAIEASAEGLHWTFAPMIDVARDPRWGRIAEGAGEDTYLAAKVGVAKIKGFQGSSLSANNTILACAKHFAAYGAAQAGRDYHTVDMSEITLRNVYLPPFKAAVEAGAATFMSAFNDVFFIPSTGSSYLLTQILRDEWGFNGFVVSDYTSINEMVPHGIVADEKQAARLAINAGLDMDMQGATYYNYLKELLDEGLVSEQTINAATRRILTLKYELGLFDDPFYYSDTAREQTLVMTPENLEFAKEFAKRTFVLLKNENNVLPLSKDIQRLAVIGPLADDKRELIGSWSAAGDYTKSVSLLEGIRNKVGNTSQIRYAKGCDINDQSREGFGEAIQLARTSDAVILAVGEYALMSGEAASRSMIDLPGVQEELIIELARTGKPIIVVLMNGRPLSLERVDTTATAILETWFAGTMAGDAIADVIFGDYNPSGKLTVSFPRNAGQIPIFYNHYNTGRPENEGKYTSKYLDVPNTPLYPFGYGLSYTSYAYSEISLNTLSIGLADTLRASVVVSNTGKMAGEEVVQLYIRDLQGSIVRPVKELKGFRKQALQPGESAIIEFIVTLDDLAFYNAKNEFKAEPGDFHLFIGPDSENVKLAKFSLTE